MASIKYYEGLDHLLMAQILFWHSAPVMHVHSEYRTGPSNDYIKLENRKNEKKGGLRSSSVIVMVAALFDEIMTLGSSVVNVTVNISTPSSILSSIMEISTNCSETPGSKVTVVITPP